MHDIGRTQDQFESEADAFESDAFEIAEETDLAGEVDTESPLDEASEMELASDLLEVTDEYELDQFLGKLFKKVGGAVGRFVKSPVGRALGGMLKAAAKKALPIAGRALGAAFGGPVGGALGGQLGSAAGQIFGLELEGLSSEDQEFEVARQFVRFAGSAAKQAALTPATASPQAAAKVAAVAAARRYAPGLVRATAVPSSTLGTGRSGRWIRRGRKIIVLGV